MKLEKKERLAAVFLVLFALWPLGHRWLVKTFDTDPWLLHGWAMYCVPRLHPEIRLAALKQGTWVEVETAGVPELHWKERRYRHFRRMIGDLADPGPVLEGVLAARPDVSEARLTVIIRRLDSETGRLRVDAKSFSRRRGP